ncbi:autotransporter outer membrane beta-barrel domain-containing protein [uncultured Mitsuokella sp.]|uniref:autotransporter outer membrane beta-barrel domain-containing protein n=1 Tax=uncultured Mitsuokella sp. TaxID=453120 RepID=UPI0025D6C06F|nr:autotransporter outer membrane beta-barrel domain-containing protein [uncultured Mitsuokella sp.]
MKHSVEMRILAGISMMAVTACWSGTNVYAAYDPATNTDTLTNQMVSPTRGDLNKGDLHSYDHADRNLVINWNKDNHRGDGSAIRDASVNAKNIIIKADFLDPYEWENKGIISDGEEKSGDHVTHVTAGGDINITTYNDAVFTETTGSTIIDGFKNLTIKSTGTAVDENDEDKPLGGYGLVDNGGGITVKGGADSTVDISTDALLPAIGNTIKSAYMDPTYFIGTGVSITAGKKITLSSPVASVYTGINKNNDFKVTLNAPEIELNGSVLAGGGTTQINGSDVTIHPSKEYTDSSGGDSIIAGNYTEQQPVKVSINENTGGKVKLYGGVNNSGNSQVTVNMTGTGSFITTVGEKDKEWGYFERNAAYSQAGAITNLKMSGDDSYIHGAFETEGGGKVNLEASGKRFKMDRSYTLHNGPDLLLSSSKDSQINASIKGDDSTVEGDAHAYGGGKINLAMSGNNAVYNGNLITEEPYAKYEQKDNANIHASFSGKNAKVAGDITAMTDHSTITLDVSGANSTYKGNAGSTGVFLTSWSSDNPNVTHYEFYDGTTVNLNLTGAHTSQTGNLEAEGNNTLNANYTGTGSSLTGNADNKGIMNLTFDNQSSMTGNMTNDTMKYDDDKGTTFDGQMKANFNNGSRWTGDLTNTSGTTNVDLNNGSLWTGNLSSAAGTTTINLNNASAWTGASTGNGDITLTGSSLWALTKDSTANSVNPDGSIVSLAGAAKKLDIKKLGGTGGTFLMDLSYHNNDVNTYRNGGGDFVVAHGGNGSAYNVSLTNNSSVNGMTDGSKLYFASTAADSSTFRMNQSVQVANYNKIYNKNLIVKKETENSDSDYKGYDDWFLTPDSSKGNGGNVINPNGIVPGSAANAAFALWRDDDTLLKRLGELRHQQQDEGVWARMVNKHLERDGHHAFHGNYKTLQVGYDKKKTTANDGNWYYGGAISHLWGNTGYTDGHGSEKATALSLYATNIRPHGHYLDLITKVGRIDSDYSTSYRDHGKFENWGTSIGAEYGRKNMLKAGWSIEPQAQLTYHYLWGDDYTTSNGAKVSQDNADSLVGRLGFVLGKDFNVGTPNVGRVYLKASVLHDFLGSTGSSITDDLTYHDDDDLGDTWYVAGVGTNIHFGKDNEFYFDAERNFNADVSMKYRFNAGFRFGF